MIHIAIVWIDTWIRQSSHIRLYSLDTAELEALKVECTETMKTKTRQYAKRQVLWIRNKLLPLCKEKDVKIFLLDATCRLECIYTMHQGNK